MARLRTSSYWILLLAVLFLGSSVLSVGQTQARYTGDTTVLNTVVLADSSAITSDCLASGTTQIILLGTLRYGEAVEATFTLNALQGVSDVLYWYITDGNLAGVSLEFAMTEGEGALGEDHTLVMDPGSKAQVTMTIAAIAEITEEKTVDVVVLCENLMGTFRVVLVPDGEEEPTDPEGEEEETDPTEPSEGEGGENTDPTEPSEGEGGENTDPTEPSEGEGGEPTDPTEPSEGEDGENTDPTEPSEGEGGENTDPTEPVASADEGTTDPTDPGEDENGESDPAEPVTSGEESGDDSQVTEPTEETTDSGDSGTAAAVEEMSVRNADSETEFESGTTDPSETGENENNSENTPEQTSETPADDTEELTEGTDDNTGEPEADTGETVEDPDAPTEGTEGDAEDPDAPTEGTEGDAEDPDAPTEGGDETVEDPDDPTGDADGEVEDPDFPGEEGDGENDPPAVSQVILKALPVFEINSTLPVSILLAGQADSLVLSMAGEAPFPAFTRYSPDGGKTYYLLYFGGFIEIDGAFGALEAVESLMWDLRLDLSRTGISADTEITLEAVARLEDQITGAAVVTTKPVAAATVTEETRILTKTKTAAAEVAAMAETEPEPDSYFVVKLPAGWDACQVEYEVSFLQSGEKGSKYEAVTLNENSLYGQLDYPARTLTIGLGEELPPAGTYRLIIRGNYEGSCFQRMQITFFINYSTRSDAEQRGAEQ